MNLNKTYSVIVLRGTRIRRFAVSKAGVRCFLWAGAILLVYGAASLSDYISAYKMKAEQIAAKAQAQREKVSDLRERTEEVQELLARWKGLREKIQASLPRRLRASSENARADEELHEILGVLQGELTQLISSFPSEWPVDGRVVSGVGMRPSPWTGKKEFHPGLDIAEPIGTPVRAAGDGIVESAGKRGGKGRTVILDHGQEIKTHYAHLSEILVKEGERVRKGQQIALVGNTGRSTGPHLHYEVRVKGIAIDPRRNFIGATSEEKPTNKNGN